MKMTKKEIIGTVVGSLVLAAIFSALATCWLGCTPEVPPCGPGTYEFRGVCLPNETEPPCGPGTIAFHGVCISDVEDHCGAGSHWDPEVCQKNGRCGMCVADETPPPTKTVEGPQQAGVGTMLVSGAGDTPTGQTIIMGSINMVFLRFELTSNSQEDIILDAVSIRDENMTAIGTLKNFKLTNGSTEYAGVSALNKSASATFGEFGGMNVKLPKGNYSIKLSVKADVAAYDDGGQVGGHRLWVTGAMATAAKSGTKILVQVQPPGSINPPAGNMMEIRRTNLVVSLAADSPSGPKIPTTEQVIAKFAVENSVNAGNYAAIMNHLKVTVAQKNVYPKSSTLRLRVYADSVQTSSLLLDSTNVYTGTIAYDIYGNIPAVEIPAGMSRALIITMDTANATFGAGAGLQISLSADAIGWTDGVGAYKNVDSLPLQGNPLTF